MEVRAEWLLENASLYFDLATLPEDETEKALWRTVNERLGCESPTVQEGNRDDKNFGTLRICYSPGIIPLGVRGRDGDKQMM